MATAPPNTNKERPSGISLFAIKVFFSEDVSPRLRLIDVIPISEPSIACFSTEWMRLSREEFTFSGKKSKSTYSFDEENILNQANVYFEVTFSLWLRQGQRNTSHENHRTFCDYPIMFTFFNVGELFTPQLDWYPCRRIKHIALEVWFTDYDRLVTGKL